MSPSPEPNLMRGPFYILLGCCFVLSSMLIVCVTESESLPEGVTGNYNIKTGLIKAESHERALKDIQRTCSHEIGHYVWYELLTEKEREEYRETYNSTNQHITFYALLGGVEEDFAESFAYAVQCGYYSELVPDDRETFFAGSVFEAWRGERNHGGWAR